MANSKPVEEICYDVNSNLFEKLKTMTRQGNRRKKGVVVGEFS